MKRLKIDLLPEGHWSRLIVYWKVLCSLNIRWGTKHLWCCCWLTVTLATSESLWKMGLTLSKWYPIELNSCYTLKYQLKVRHAVPCRHFSGCRLNNSYCSGNANDQVMTWIIDWVPGRKAGPTRLTGRGWSQDPPLPRPHLRIGSGGESFSLEIPVYVRSFEGKQLLFFIFVSLVIAFDWVLSCCSHMMLLLYLHIHVGSGYFQVKLYAEEVFK